MVKTIDIRSIRTIAQFNSLIEKIEKSSDQYLLKRKGKAIAALVPSANLEAIAEHEPLSATEDLKVMAEHRKALFKVMDRVHAKNPGLIEEEVEKDIMAARDEIRRTHGQR